jgi:hypothetical protein
MHTGSVIVSTEAASVLLPSQRIRMNPSLADDALSALVAAGMPATQGRTVTVPEPLMSGVDKQRHGALTGASVVDMETFWIAQEANQAEIPLVSVRAVIDEMHHDLPDVIARITADGGQREWYHMLRSLKNPANIGGVIPLAARSRKAVAALRSVVGILIPLLTTHAPMRESHR